MKGKGLWIGIVVALLVIGGVAYALANRNNNSSYNKSSTTSSYGSSTSSTNSSTSSTPNKSVSNSVVSTMTDKTLGSYLVSASGMPVYTYGSDSKGVSNCTGSCLSFWPVYGPASSSASLPTDITVITRSDGKAQYAYKGLPLYTFTSDSTGSAPTGNGVDNFNLARP